MLDISETCRSIQADPQYERELSELIADTRRSDEFIDGTIWLLSRRPEYGQPVVEGSAVRMVAVDGEAVGLPPLVLYYTYNDTHVTFLSIQQSQDDPF